MLMVTHILARAISEGIRIRKESGMNATSNQTDSSFDELEGILLWVKGDKDEGDNRKV